MRKLWLAIPLLSLLALPAVAQNKQEEKKEDKKEEKEEDRVENAGKVFKEILDAPDSIPQDVLDKTKWLQGADLDFLVGCRGTTVTRESH